MQRRVYLPHTTDARQALFLQIAPAVVGPVTVLVRDLSHRVSAGHQLPDDAVRWLMRAGSRTTQTARRVSKLEKQSEMPHCCSSGQKDQLYQSPTIPDRLGLSKLGLTRSNRRGTGPVCPVVWEGRRREAPPIPINPHTGSDGLEAYLRAPCKAFQSLIIIRTSAEPVFFSRSPHGPLDSLSSSIAQPQ